MEPSMLLFLRALAALQDSSGHGLAGAHSAAQVPTHRQLALLCCSVNITFPFIVYHRPKSKKHWAEKGFFQRPKISQHQFSKKTSTFSLEERIGKGLLSYKAIFLQKKKKNPFSKIFNWF